MERPSLTLGIEEEYLLVDPETRNLVAEPKPVLFAACRDRLGDRVSPELLQCQIEVGTRPHPTVGAAVAELRGLRRAVAEVAADHGYRVIAASVHPFGRWRRQAPTDKERYEKLWEAMGQPGRRMLICGMHIHAGVEDPEQRITLMNQVAQLLPLLLALSASSPFWQGADTDMASYRLAVYGELPRTGPPDRMASHHAYAALIGDLVAVGAIEDGTKLWWDVRPSARFPTLEQRITDICPRLDDVAALAAWYQATLAWLHALGARGEALVEMSPTLVRENRWIAQRHGSDAQLIDATRRRVVPVADLVEEALDRLGGAAEALGCRPELAGLGRIAAEGSSTTRQRAVLAWALADGAGRGEALCAVVDSLIAEFPGDAPDPAPTAAGA